LHTVQVAMRSSQSNPTNAPHSAQGAGPARGQRATQPTQLRAPRFDPTALLAECRRVLKHFNAYFFCTKAQLPYYIAFAQQNGLAWDLLVWEHGYLAHEYSSSCEFIVTMWERDTFFNPEMKDSFFQKVKHQPAIRRNGPEFQAEKPHKLVQEFIQQRTKPGALVLDPFAGAGTVPAGCVQTGRSFIAFEASPKWYAEAKKNIEKAALESQTATPDTAAQPQLLFNYR
jgi:DNA modification methylase